MSRQNKTCPVCDKKMKSSSGYTLHINKCCPEMRFVETRVKLEIEVTIPRDVTAINGPLRLFHDSFGPYEKKDGGRASAISAQIIGEPVVNPRKPTKYELEKMAKAEKNKSKAATVAELKKIIDAAIEEKWKLQANTSWIHFVRNGEGTSGGWPNYIKIAAICPPPKGHRYSTHSVYFVFDLKKETVIIWINETSVRQSTKEVRLADPKLFEIIRVFRDKKGK